MAKRKSTTSKSRATSSKIRRTQPAEVNLPAPIPSQSVTEVENFRAVSEKRYTWPVTPPRAHARYVPPTPRVDCISISNKVTLSLDIKGPEGPTDFFKTHAPTPTPAADVPRLEFISCSTQSPDDTSSCVLRPVFNWDNPAYPSKISDISSDSDGETQSDEEAENNQKAIGEQTAREPVEEVTDEEKTLVTNSLDGEKDNSDSKQATQAEGGEEGQKASVMAAADSLDKEPGIEEALEHCEQDADTPASVSPSV